MIDITANIHMSSDGMEIAAIMQAFGFSIGSWGQEIIKSLMSEAN